MGKGGTKFESEAIGVRAGRKKSGPSLKEMKRDMERFRKTGRHPGLEGGRDHVLPSLPFRDPNRPHAFMSFKSGKIDIGRIIVEVFEPELPTTARTFLNRCNPGAANTFKGTKVDRVVENYAIFGGVSSGHKPAQQRRSEFLKHVQPGLVSITVSADAFAVSFERALTLDDTHQVIGRLHGEESTATLEKLNEIAVGANDEPLHSLRVSDCGQTDSQGNYDPLLGGSKRKETPEEAAARLQQEEAEARDAVGAALQAGLANKRPTAGAAKPGAAKRKKMLPAFDDSEEEDSGSGGDSE